MPSVSFEESRRVQVYEAEETVRLAAFNPGQKLLDVSRKW
jgi:hypothetical protein